MRPSKQLVSIWADRQFDPKNFGQAPDWDQEQDPIKHALRSIGANVPDEKPVAQAADKDEGEGLSFNAGFQAVLDHIRAHGRAAWNALGPGQHDALHDRLRDAKTIAWGIWLRLDHRYDVPAAVVRQVADNAWGWAGAQAKDAAE